MFPGGGGEDDMQPFVERVWKSIVGGGLELLAGVLHKQLMHVLGFSHAGTVRRIKGWDWSTTGCKHFTPRPIKSSRPTLLHLIQHRLTLSRP